MYDNRQSVLHRSYLFVPAHDQRKVAKALSSDADAVVLDLEDSLPNESRAQARHIVASVVGAPHEVEIHVRPGRTSSGALLEGDIIAALGPNLAALRLPKVDADSCAATSILLDQLETDAGLRRGSVGLYPTFESADALVACREILSSSSRIVRPIFGHADFASDLGLWNTDVSAPILTHSMAHLALCSHAILARPPIDGAYIDLDDSSGLVRNARAAKDLGYFGKSVIHPSQIDAVHGVFAPSQQEIEWALAVEGAFVDATVRGEAVATVGGVMVDSAVAARAAAILQSRPSDV